MPFITQGKTNWKFLLIIIILAIIVGGGALWYAKRPEQSYQPVEINKSATADWKTFINEEYGFKIKYLKEWTVYKLVNEDWISFVSDEWTDFEGKKQTDGAEPGIFRHPNERKRIDIVVEELTSDFQEWLGERGATVTSGKDIKVGVGNYEGKEFKTYPQLTSETILRTIFLPHNSLVFSFRMDEDGPSMAIFNQMLSTFNFSR